MLSDKKCVPSAPGMLPMGAEQAQGLLAEVPGWELVLESRALKRRWAFKDFATAQAFVNKVGALAEEQGHHPDIMLGWGYAEIVLWTHAVVGLHENDFIMASKINQLKTGA